jgi:hypothetical protein
MSAALDLHECDTFERRPHLYCHRHRCCRQYQFRLRRCQAENLLKGGAGNDNLSSAWNVNTAYGDEGDDQLYFIGNQNTLFGDSEDDWLGVNGDSNALYGASGNDWIGASGIGNTLAGR